MSSALPFPYEDDGNNFSFDDDSSSASSGISYNNNTDTDTDTDTDNEGNNANGNNNASHRTSSVLASPSPSASALPSPSPSPSLSSSASKKSSFLSPPPSVPSSNDNPIRPRSVPRHSSPSISMSHLLSPSSLPSLSSTPTSTATATNTAGFNTGIDDNNSNSRNNSRSNSRNNTPVSNRTYIEMANRPRSNPRNRRGSSSWRNSRNNNDAGIVGTFHRLSVGNDNDYDSDDNGNNNGNNNDHGDNDGNNYTYTYADAHEDGTNDNTNTGTNTATNTGTGSYFQRRQTNNTYSTSNTNTTSSTSSSSSSSTQTHNISIGGRVVGLTAGLAIGTILRNTNDGSGRLTALREEMKPKNTKSDKQRPGQRKQRRWNNDKFIGIASEISSANPKNGTRIANLYAEAEMEKSKYTMPNFPRHCRTIFGTLATLDKRTGGGTIGGTIGAGNTTGTGKTRDGSTSMTFSQENKDFDDRIDEKIYGLNRNQLRKVRQRFVDGEV